MMSEKKAFKAQVEAVEENVGHELARVRQIVQDVREQYKMPPSGSAKRGAMLACDEILRRLYAPRPKAPEPPAGVGDD